MKLTKFALLAVAASCTLASQGVYAQAMEVVTVEAVREIIVGKSPIGAPIIGWVADAIGPAASLVGLGLVLLLTAAVAVSCVRRARPVLVAQA